MGPEAVTSIVLRLCLEMTSGDPSSSPHINSLFIVHLIMVMRNVATLHSEEQTRALASYLTVQLQDARPADAARFLSTALRVRVTEVDVRERITVRVNALHFSFFSSGRLCMSAWRLFSVTVT